MQFASFRVNNTVTGNAARRQKVLECAGTAGARYSLGRSPHHRSDPEWDHSGYDSKSLKTTAQLVYAGVQYIQYICMPPVYVPIVSVSEHMGWVRNVVLMSVYFGFGKPQGVGISGRGMGG